MMQSVRRQQQATKSWRRKLTNPGELLLNIKIEAERAANAALVDKLLGIADPSSDRVAVDRDEAKRVQEAAEERRVGDLRQIQAVAEERRIEEAKRIESRYLDAIQEAKREEARRPNSAPRSRPRPL